MTTQAPVNVFVCVTCKDAGGEPVGQAFHDALSTAEGIMLHAAECLAVCKRPCTVALSQPGKWTYLVGDLTLPDAHDFQNYITTYAASEHGTPPFKERPACVRKGTLARIPPTH